MFLLNTSVGILWTGSPLSTNNSVFKIWKEATEHQKNNSGQSEAFAKQSAEKWNGWQNIMWLSSFPDVINFILSSANHRKIFVIPKCILLMWHVRQMKLTAVFSLETKSDMPLFTKRYLTSAYFISLSQFIDSKAKFVNNFLKIVLGLFPHTVSWKSMRLFWICLWN